MRIVEVDEEYIELLMRHFAHVMDPKVNRRKHTRKYLGVVFKIGKHNYYAPLSSPKKFDYNSDGTVKKNTLFSFKIVRNKDSEFELLGTIKFQNMIPVPDSLIYEYDAETENDINYKNLILEEIEEINKNQTKILRTAKTIYYVKKNEFFNGITHYTNLILPFYEIEEFIESMSDFNIITIDQIKERTIPVFKKHGIKEAYLFGSYSRGEATRFSDVDIYCDNGDVNTLFELSGLKYELVETLGKKVDIVTFGSRMDDCFREELEKDKIKLF